jgi:shikimate dehydrogenase
MQQAALDDLGIDARFEAWEAVPSELATVVGAMRSGDCLGASVTIPHKQAVIALMDEVTPGAMEVGAVNCIVVRDGSLIGHNTDGSGFVAALRERANFDATEKRALLIGAGGAARALAHALIGRGVSSLTIANRTRARAEVLAAELGRDIVPISLDPEDLTGPAATADLIVNSTSLGMSSGDGAACSPLPGALIPSEALVNDIVYNPPLTPLLRAAQARGARILGGLPMLVYQGAAAFELWTGRDAPIDAMFAAAEGALSIKEAAR